MKFLAGLLGALSGSKGGITASHNRYGAYLRHKAIPVNPNTDRQQAVRSIFQTLSNAWSNVLTSIDRGKWNMYGSIVTMKDKLGQDIHLTGYNHFLRSNSIALLGSVAQVNAGPTIYTLADADETMVGTVDEAAQEISVAFDDTLPWLDESGSLMMIAMSKPANIGCKYVPPTYRIAGFILGDSATPPTTPETMTCPFSVAEGQKVLVAGRIFRADGRLSSMFQKGTVVTA